MSESMNFSVFQGDSLVINITYKDPEGQPVDLFDYDVVASVRDQFGGKVRCATVSKDNGITLSEYEDSGKYAKIRVEFSPEDTVKFTVPKAALQIKIISSGGIETTILYGTIDVRKPTVYA